MKAEQNRQLEISILKVLSDFAPRNQNTITKAVGKSSDNSNDRVAVHRGIRRIERYLDRARPELVRVGENRWMQDTGKIWKLKKDIKTLQHLILSYPELIPVLQANDAVLSMLVEKHTSHVCTEEWLSDVQEKDFRNRLRISATFFRLWLLEEPGELRKTINTLFSITEIGQVFEQHNIDIMKSIWGKKGNKKECKPRYKSMKDLGFAGYQPGFNDLIDIVFRTCVGADVLYSQESKEGIEFVKTLNPIIGGRKA